MKTIALALILGSLVTATACDSGDGDDINEPVDAALDTSGGDGDGGTDGGGACVLPSAVINCTIGDNAPCTAVCGGAYCHNFNQVGNVCTSACTPGGTGECPTGWTCNNMSRCRPPG